MILIPEQHEALIEDFKETYMYSRSPVEFLLGRIIFRLHFYRQEMSHVMPILQ